MLHQLARLETHLVDRLTECTKASNHIGNVGKQEGTDRSNRIFPSSSMRQTDTERGNRKRSIEHGLFSLRLGLETLAGAWPLKDGPITDALGAEEATGASSTPHDEDGSKDRIGVRSASRDERWFHDVTNL
jgi:hypothetical protein